MATHNTGEKSNVWHYAPTDKHTQHADHLGAQEIAALAVKARLKRKCIPFCFNHLGS